MAKCEVCVGKNLLIKKESVGVFVVDGKNIGLCEGHAVERINKITAVKSGRFNLGSLRTRAKVIESMTDFSSR